MNEESTHWGWTYTVPDFKGLTEMLKIAYRNNTFMLKGRDSPDYFITELECSTQDEDFLLIIHARYPRRPYPERVAPVFTIFYDNPDELYRAIYYVMDLNGSVNVVDEYYRPIFSRDSYDDPDEDLFELMDMLRIMGVYGEALFDVKPPIEYLTH